MDFEKLFSACSLRNLPTMPIITEKKNQVRVDLILTYLLSALIGRLGSKILA